MNASALLYPCTSYVPARFEGTNLEERVMVAFTVGRERERTARGRRERKGRSGRRLD